MKIIDLIDTLENEIEECKVTDGENNWDSCDRASVTLSKIRNLITKMEDAKDELKSVLSDIDDVI
jgi:hypothetical protein